MKMEELIWKKLDGNLSQDEMIEFENNLNQLSFKSKFEELSRLHEKLKSQNTLTVPANVTESIMLRIAEQKAVSKRASHFSPPFMLLIIAMISIGPAILIAHFTEGASWQTDMMHWLQLGPTYSMLFLVPIVLFSLLLLDAFWNKVRTRQTKMSFLLV